jgi:hypothetical protein
MVDTKDTNASETQEVPTPTESAGVKDLDYYAAHPEEIPGDARGIDDLSLRLSETSETGETPDSETQASEQDVKTASSGPETQEIQETPNSEQGVETASPGREPVILSKDGKTELPYIALSSEREKARRAGLLAEQMGARIRELEAALASGEKAPEKSGASDPPIDLDDESFKQAAADFPAIEGLLKYSAALEKKLAGVEERFKSIEQAERDRQAGEARAAQDEVRAIVDGNPFLLYYEQHAPEKWTAAIEADNSLQRLNPSLSTQKRLEKVVEVVELVMGETDLPPEFAAMQATRTTPPAQPNTAETQPKIDDAKRKPPLTLGEIAGGNPPAPDELEELAKQRPEELERLMRESPKRMEALLKRFG